MSNKERVADCSVERSNIGFFAIRVSHPTPNTATSWCGKHCFRLLSVGCVARWKVSPCLSVTLEQDQRGYCLFNVVFFVLKRGEMPLFFPLLSCSMSYLSFGSSPALLLVFSWLSWDEWHLFCLEINTKFPWNQSVVCQMLQTEQNYQLWIVGRCIALSNLYRASSYIEAKQ